MGKVVLDMAVSLDGFIAGPDGVDVGLHRWFFEPTEQDQAMIDESVETMGAIIIGRNTYNLGEQYDGFVDNTHQIMHFVLTHAVPAQVAKGNTPFTFVTDGIHSALRQAQALAGDKVVGIGGGASNAQQYLRAGLIDEIVLHLAPVLVGEGIRLFDHTGQLELETIRVIQTPTTTHLRFRIIQ